MIIGFRHKGLKKLFETGVTAGVCPEHVSLIRSILALLATADSIHDMNLPGLSLHELRGVRKGTWSVTVRANWRITFRFIRGDCDAVNYEDYH